MLVCRTLIGKTKPSCGVFEPDRWWLLLPLACVVIVVSAGDTTARTAVELRDRTSTSLPSRHAAEYGSSNTIVIGGLAPIDFARVVYQPPRGGLAQEDWQRIQDAIDENIEMLAGQGSLPLEDETVVLGWPLQPSRELTDYDYHGIWDFVDHNPAYPGALEDFACGSRTYDTAGGYNHRGTDFFLWPFPWKKVENAEVEVIAAAPGTIVYKQDGNFDRQCSWVNSTWNAVYVRHHDGTTAWYGHLKNGSLTGKGVGDSVVAGEYLGAVASSGISGGPHLHFQLQGADYATLDPFVGPCNPSETWWAFQRPYYDSGVNAVTTGPAPPELPECPNPENPNIDDNFLPGDTVYFSAYFRDQLAGQEGQYTVYEPDGTIFSRWTHSINAPHYDASMMNWGHYLRADVPLGTWRFEVLFEGRAHERYFNVGDVTTIEVLAPNGAEDWEPARTYEILWDDNLGGNVRVELYKGGVYHSTIAKSTASDGRLDWSVPPSAVPGVDYSVVITNEANPTLFDQSDEPFSIAVGSLVHKSFLPVLPLN